MKGDRERKRGINLRELCSGIVRNSSLDNGGRLIVLSNEKCFCFKRGRVVVVVVMKNLDGKLIEEKKKKENYYI